MKKQQFFELLEEYDKKNIHELDRYVTFEIDSDVNINNDIREYFTNDGDGKVKMNLTDFIMNSLNDDRLYEVLKELWHGIPSNPNKSIYNVKLLLTDQTDIAKKLNLSIEKFKYIYLKYKILQGFCSKDFQSGLFMDNEVYFKNIFQENNYLIDMFVNLILYWDINIFDELNKQFKNLNSELFNEKTSNILESSKQYSPKDDIQLSIFLKMIACVILYYCKKQKSNSENKTIDKIKKNIKDNIIDDQEKIIALSYLTYLNSLFQKKKLMTNEQYFKLFGRVRTTKYEFSQSIAYDKDQRNKRKRENEKRMSQANNFHEKYEQQAQKVKMGSVRPTTTNNGKSTTQNTTQKKKGKKRATDVDKERLIKKTFEYMVDINLLKKIIESDDFRLGFHVNSLDTLKTIYVKNIPIFNQLMSILISLKSRINIDSKKQQDNCYIKARLNDLSRLLDSISTIFTLSINNKSIAENIKLLFQDINSNIKKYIELYEGLCSIPNDEPEPNQVNNSKLNEYLDILDIDIDEFSQLNPSEKVQKLKDSYKRLSIVRHPNKHPNEINKYTKEFQILLTAYEELRKIYHGIETNVKVNNSKLNQYLDILGIDNTMFSTLNLREKVKKIKESYKSLALEKHPNKHRNKPQNKQNEYQKEFQIIDNAYKELRKIYAGILSTSNVPTGNVPTETVPTETVPTGNVPTETVPTRNVPTETVPTGNVPTGNATVSLKSTLKNKNKKSNSFSLSTKVLPPKKLSNKTNLLDIIIETLNSSLMEQVQLFRHSLRGYLTQKLTDLNSFYSLFSPFNTLFDDNFYQTDSNGKFILLLDNDIIKRFFSDLTDKIDPKDIDKYKQLCNNIQSYIRYINHGVEFINSNKNEETFKELVYYNFFHNLNNVIQIILKSLNQLNPQYEKLNAFQTVLATTLSIMKNKKLYEFKTEKNNTKTEKFVANRVNVKKFGKENVKNFKKEIKDEISELIGQNKNSNMSSLLHKLIKKLNDKYQIDPVKEINKVFLDKLKSTFSFSKSINSDRFEEIIGKMVEKLSKLKEKDRKDSLLEFLYIYVISFSQQERFKIFENIRQTKEGIRKSNVTVEEVLSNINREKEERARMNTIRATLTDFERRLLGTLATPEQKLLEYTAKAEQLFKTKSANKLALVLSKISSNSPLAKKYIKKHQPLLLKNKINVPAIASAANNTAAASAANRNAAASAANRNAAAAAANNAASAKNTASMNNASSPTRTVANSNAASNSNASAANSNAAVNEAAAAANLKAYENELLLVPNNKLELSHKLLSYEKKAKQLFKTQNQTKIKEIIRNIQTPLAIAYTNKYGSLEKAKTSNNFGLSVSNNQQSKPSFKKKNSEIIAEVTQKLMNMNKVPVGPKRIAYRQKIGGIISTIKSNNKLNISSIDDYIKEVRKRLPKK